MISKRKRGHRVVTQKAKPVYAVYSCFTAGSLCSRLEAPTFGCGLTTVFRIIDSQSLPYYDVIKSKLVI